MNITPAQTKPLCPFCGQPIDHLEKVPSTAGEEVNVYICPVCHKILAVHPLVNS